jgi:hypothetical protein
VEEETPHPLYMFVAILEDVVDDGALILVPHMDLYV